MITLDNLTVLKKQAKKRSTSRVFTQFFIYLLVVILAMTFALPLVWLISSAFKIPSQLFKVPPIWIPNPVSWKNFENAITEINLILEFRNTLVICCAVVVGSVISNAIIAYGFSRIKWPGRDKIFGIVLATMMVPWAVTLVPLFITFRKLGWIDTYLPFIVPAFFGNPFFIFLLRQFFLTIPFELSESARIDGANELQILFQLILPLTRPALATVAMFSFLWTWGDYFGPLIYIRTPDKYTLALGVSSFIQSLKSGADYGAMMAGSLLSVLPIIVLFFFTQRTFIEGITFTGIKG